MTSAAWSKIQDLFHRALEVDENERDAFVRLEARGDVELAEAVLRLLRHDDEAPKDFIEPPLLEGQRLRGGRRLGDYEVEGEIGRGRMGVVYRGHQPSLDRVVAIKVLTGAFATTGPRVERFHREARAVAKLSHPAIIRIFADGHDDAVHWFAMEYVDGNDLETELRARGEHDADSEQATPILPARGSTERTAAIADLVARVAEGLQHAHDHGIVHRDIKPSNILLARDGSIRIADFGIARDESLGTLTETGQVLGSLPYMSPEQAAAHELRIDHRTDVYSLGVVLYEFLAMRRPFGGTTAVEILSNIRRGQPPSLKSLNRDLPRDLATICEKAMRSDPAKRYQTAAEFAEDLRRFLRFEAIRARPPSITDRAMQTMRAHRFAGSVIAIAILAMVGGAWWMQWRTKGETLKQEVDSLVSLDRIVDWSEIDIATMTEAKRVAERLERDSSSSDVRMVVTRFATRLHAYMDQLQTESRRLLAQTPATDSVLQFGTAMESIVRHAAIGGDQAAVADSLNAEVRVALAEDAVHVPATYWIAYLDRYDGEPVTDSEERLVNGAPIKTVPGMVRILVRAPNKPMREYSRTLRAGTATEVVVRYSSALDETRDMVRVDGGVLEREPYGINGPTRKPWRIHPFWIDAYEVSIGEYREFLTAMGPDYPKADSLASMMTGEYDDLPITHVSWEEARDYAEWRGKRLPTVGEWNWAARGGNELRRYPWNGDTWPACFRSEGRPSNIFEGASLDLNLRMFHPVRSHPEAATVIPAGIHWMLGNVGEWTETPVLEPGVDGTELYRIQSRYAPGHSWDVRARGLDLNMQMKADTGPANRRFDVGFRCVRSIDD
ncbi:MAG: protein kinase [Planctomycetes bacterium]|nr:protein kinase [Planctomycetota bacterium]MCB9890442.1 protein kinase [Planctomycetota bacterium]MCB9917683.1 protein kinase [Planctomycetota bacterium]